MKNRKWVARALWGVSEDTLIDLESAPHDSNTTTGNTHLCLPDPSPIYLSNSSSKYSDQSYPKVLPASVLFHPDHEKASLTIISLPPTFFQASHALPWPVSGGLLQLFFQYPRILFLDDQLQPLLEWLSQLQTPALFHTHSKLASLLVLSAFQLACTRSWADPSLPRAGWWLCCPPRAPRSWPEWPCEPFL